MSNKIKKNVGSNEGKFQIVIYRVHPPYETYEVIAGESLFENPCSYEAVEKVYQIMIFIYKLTCSITISEENCRS